ncbi:MAG: multiple sugar transport system substrate-binding protein [Microbacteriaceae bacterium]|jgi:multiple sugar transport system substrate-binding protein|nr:multiple sugar transport system substrate-binding protein [Microbacteriaceae bacterium]
MKKSLRLGAMLATAAIATMALVSCSSGGSSSSSTSGVKSIKVVIAEYSSATKPFWTAFAAKYKATTGITMNLQIISWTDINQASSTMIQTGNLPDILNENSYASYAADGLLYDSSQVLPAATKADIIPAFVQSGTVNGKFYGMPDLSSARAMFYNKDLFKQAGIAAPPTTWTEFVADAQKVQALGGGNVGYAQPLGPEEAQAEFAIWLFNNGGAFKQGNKWVINSPANVKTLQFMKDLSVKYGVTQNNPGATNRTDGAFALFAQGKAGMVVGFSPLSGTLDKAKTVNYGIAPMPSGDGKAPQTYGVTDYLMSFKKPGNQAAISAFYKLYYSPDQINTWIKAENFLPATTSGLKVFQSDPALASLKVYLDTLPNAHLTPTDDPEWDKVKLTLQQTLGLAVAPNGDPQKYLDNLQAQAVAGK